MSKYLNFQDATPPERKTKIIKVLSANNNVSLGEIRFWSAWRQYTFQPEGSTLFDIKCLKEITAKLDEMNTEIRKEWRERKILKEETA